MSDKIKNAVTAALFGLWILGFLIAGLIIPDAEISVSERRKLRTFPELSLNTLSDGSFMSEFEKYSADQFPLRESFRRVKSIGGYKIFNRLDSNGIYMYKGYASKLEKAVNTDSLDYAAGRFSFIYDKFLKDAGGRVFLSVIPDKNYFMQDSGVPHMDYDELVSHIRSKTDFATYIDIFPTLSLDCYYKTDTHWRQEKIGAAADKIAEALGHDLKLEYSVNELDQPFYGVYYGQSALPMPGERMYYLENPLFDDVTVYNLEAQSYTPIYDLDRAEGMDPYEIYLSGPRSMMTIENPKAESGRELIIFRDSFGSSIAPYFIEAYSKITLVDIRYLPAPMLNRYLDFDGADVLFLYSTLILNSSETLT